MSTTRCCRALRCRILAAPALAQEKPVLTVYTYSGFPSEYGPGGTIKERFEAVCGCTLEWVESDDAGTLLARLKLEGSSTKADVVLGLDTNQIADAEATGLFAPHGVDTSGLDLPVAWTDPTFIPFDWGWFAFVYDQTKVPEPPTSLSGAGGSRGRTEDRHRGSAHLDARPRSARLDARRLWRQGRRCMEETRAENHDRDAGLVGGLRPVREGRGRHGALLHHVSRLPHRGRAGSEQEGGDLYRRVIISRSRWPGMTKATDTPELAKRFMDFILTEPFQSAIPEGNWMYPAKLPAGGLPASFQALGKPEKSLYADPEEVEKNRRAWVDEWLGGAGERDRIPAPSWGAARGGVRQTEAPLR